MNYFLDIRNNFYHLWQTELLIESFKLHNMADDLVLGLTLGKEVNNYNNVANHPRKIAHQEFSAYNKITTMIFCLEQGILKQPFAYIHPDMVLYKPLTDVHSHLTYQLHSKSYKLKHYVMAELKSILPLTQADFYWKEIGNIIIFNDLPMQFFYQIVSWMNFLGKKYSNIDFDLEKAAMLLAIESTKGITCSEKLDLEQNLSYQDVKANFIHYSEGLPPDFHKQNHKNQEFMRQEHPYKLLKKNNCTLTTNYICNIINQMI